MHAPGKRKASKATLVFERPATLHGWPWWGSDAWVRDSGTRLYASAPLPALPFRPRSSIEGRSSLLSVRHSSSPSSAQASTGRPSLWIHRRSSSDRWRRKTCRGGFFISQKMPGASRSIVSSSQKVFVLRSLGCCLQDAPPAERARPSDRKLGCISTSLLIVNRMVGTGIFSTPSTIMQATDNVGSTMLFWVLGGFMTFWWVVSCADRSMTVMMISQHLRSRYLVRMLTVVAAQWVRFIILPPFGDAVPMADIPKALRLPGTWNGDPALRRRESIRACYPSRTLAPPVRSRGVWRSWRGYIAVPSISRRACSPVSYFLSEARADPLD